MRVATYYRNDDVRLEERPKPKIGPGELLVQVAACGVCGSDVMEWYRIKRAPLVLGHELTGTIVEVGNGVKKFSVGDRVFLSHHVPCQNCDYCKRGDHTVCDLLAKTNLDPGGFTEFTRVPAVNMECGVFLLPKEVSFEEGTFVEPLGCVVRGLRLCEFAPGQSVLIIGSGISGVLHASLISASSDSFIAASDIDAKRLDVIQDFGVQKTFLASQNVAQGFVQENGGRGADLVVVTAGNAKAYETALEAVDRGGTVLWFAPMKPQEKLSFRMADLWRKGVRQIPTYGAAPRDLKEAMELIEKRKVPVARMITHRFGLGEAGEAFSLTAKAGASMKVIIEPSK